MLDDQKIHFIIEYGFGGHIIDMDIKIEKINYSNKMRVLNQSIILKWIYNEAVSYPTPINTSFFWSFGVMALSCLISQVLSGIFLAMHYIPSADLAFSSVEHIM